MNSAESLTRCFEGVNELEERAVPSSAEEGWMRDQEKAAKQH